MEEKKKYKHHVTDEIIEVSVCDGSAFINGKFFDVVYDTNGSHLKGTSYYEIVR